MNRDQDRDLDRLSTHKYDVLVIGGGIHGAMAAWDAALRGLSVALVERGDFGSVTSQNSLRIIHGGLRYLQDGSLAVIRSMSRERTTWMRIAPHLVHPLRCLMPTFPKPMRSRLAMGGALAINDLLSYDRNSLVDPEKFLPDGQILSAEEGGRLIPGCDRSDMTGAAVWHDGKVHNSERLLLEIVLSAAQAGASVANYVEAAGFLCAGRRIIGVQARDVLTGQEFEVHARVVINCAGAWVGRLLETAPAAPALQSNYSLSVAMNLVVNQVWAGCAVGLPSRPGGKRRSQMLFIVPWRSKSMIGTWHIPWPHSPDDFRLDEAVLQEFLDEINSASPRFALTLDDVQHVHWGFLPMDSDGKQPDHVRLVRHGRVVDHQKEDRLSGLLTLVGVKFTTARQVAEQAVNLAIKQLGEKPRPCNTHCTPLVGGHIRRFSDCLSSAHAQAPANLDAEIVDHLVYTYGSQYPTIFKLIQEEPGLGERVDPDSPVTAAEVIHAVRCEMAVSLLDVVQRRTELGTTGLPSPGALQTCAGWMGSELGWNMERQEQEIEAVRQAYPFRPKERSMV